MKSIIPLSILILFLTYSQNDFAQYPQNRVKVFFLYDNSTQKEIEDAQVTEEIKITYRDCLRYMAPETYTKSYTSTKHTSTGIYSLFLDDLIVNDNCYYRSTLYYTLTFSAPGYEEKIVSQEMEGSQWHSSNNPTQNVYLNPIKKQISIEGNLTVNSKNINELPDILTIEEAASYLKVSKSDILILIEKKELRAKLVGENYIITKKELIKFLEK